MRGKGEEEEEGNGRDKSTLAPVLLWLAGVAAGQNDMEEARGN